MAELGAKQTQIVKRHPLGSAALFLLVIGIAFELLWLVVVVVIGAGSIAWFRFDQRRQLEAWIEDEGLGPEAMPRHTPNRNWHEELVPELSLESLRGLLAGKRLPRVSEPIAREDEAPPLARRPLPRASKAMREMGMGRLKVHEIHSHEDANPGSRGGNGIPARGLGNAGARREGDGPDRQDERAPGSAPSGEEVRARLERPLSGLRDAGRTRRGLVFHY